MTMATTAEFIAALRRNDRSAAVAIGWALLEQGAQIGDQWHSIARFAASSMERQLAIAASRKSLAIWPEDPERILTLADMLAGAGRLDEAASLIAAAAPTRAGDPRFLHLLGTAELQLGDPAQGLRHLSAASRAWPQSGMTWLAIAGAHRYTSGDTASEMLSAAGKAMVGAPSSAQAAYFYAMGKMYDDVGEVDRAFASFAAGAKLVRAERPYDRAADRAVADAIMAAFSPFLGNEPADVCDHPIFVTGLPRSGTTLVEQILVSHSAVIGGGELNLTAMAAEVTGGGDPAAVLTHAATGKGWGTFRNQYRHLRTQRFPPVGMIVDKSLNTSRYAGLIHRAMPDAPVLWLHRDPLDTAWSCFRTCFTSDLGWSFDLEDMGWHFAIEDRLRMHWQDVYGPRLMTVSYAALVTEPRSMIPAMLSHVGLAPEPGVFDFHRSKRAINTASVVQVRQPLYTTAVGSADPYSAHMAPFLESYEKARRAIA